MTQDNLLGKIELIQQRGVSTARTPYAPLLIDAYSAFLKSNGKVRIVKCTNKLLQDLLQDGPVLAIVSYNYLYDYPRVSYNKSTNDYEPDPIRGKALEHAIVVTGFSDGRYYINDPDIEMGGQHAIDDDVLIGAICTAQLNSDNYLMTISRNV